VERSSGAVAALAAGLVLCFAGAALAGTSPMAPVPASFAAKAAHICRELKAALDVPLPPNVRRAFARMPGYATKAQDVLAGNWLAAHELPADNRAVSRFEALGRPKAGQTAWTGFLTNWEDWVFLEERFVHGMQQGSEFVDFDARHRAWLRMKPVGSLTGTTFCLSFTG
jgi:hypothetical protein